MATAQIPDFRLDLREQEYQRLAQKAAANEAAFQSALVALRIRCVPDG